MVKIAWRNGHTYSSAKLAGYPLDGSMIPCYFTLEELRVMYSWLRRIGENKHVNSLNGILENIKGKIDNEEGRN